MKIKKILDDLISWIFVCFTLIGFIILLVAIGLLFNTNTVDKIFFYYLLIGLLFIFPFLYYVIKTNFFITKYRNKEAKRIANLIRNGDTLIVNLNEVKIKTNKFRRVIEYREDHNTQNKFVDVNHNVILLEIPYRNDSIKYRIDVDMDNTKLKMLLAMKQHTKLYVDPTNPNNNYLDLGFFEDENETTYDIYSY